MEEVCGNIGYKENIMSTKFNKDFQDRFLAGQASDVEIYEAMKELVESGSHHSARGYYRRLAQTMIDGGWFNTNTNQNTECI